MRNRPREAKLQHRPTPVRFWGPPPLIKGEDSAAYDELLARITGELNRLMLWKKYSFAIALHGRKMAVGSGVGQQAASLRQNRYQSSGTANFSAVFFDKLQN